MIGRVCFDTSLGLRGCKSSAGLTAREADNERFSRGVGLDSITDGLLENARTTTRLRLRVLWGVCMACCVCGGYRGIGLGFRFPSIELWQTTVIIVVIVIIARWWLVSRRLRVLVEKGGGVLSKEISLEADGRGIHVDIVEGSGEG